MTPEIFFNNFVDLADAPNGVQKLRELILQLAVRGKLVPQESTDEPAAKLLERIRAGKVRLASERRIRNDDSDSMVPAYKVPYELPGKWEWVTFGQVAIIQGGKRLPAGTAFSEHPTSHIYIQVTNMKSGTIVTQNLKYISDAVFEEIRRYVINKEDLYITIAGTIAQSGEVPEFFDGMNLTENAAKLVFRGINKKFFLLALQSEALQEQFREKTNKLAQPKLALKRIASAYLPLPPLAEQERIVTKVDQLMALCNELETRQRKKQLKLLRLNNAVLDLLTSVRKADDFTASWQLVCGNFDLLYTTPETIVKLRQSILQLAVQGRLVPQEPSDELASVLMTNVQRLKKKMIANKEIKEPKFLDNSSTDDLIGKIPSTWQIARLGDLTCSGPQNGYSPKPVEYKTGVKSLTLSATTKGNFDGHYFKYIDEVIPQESDMWLKSSDILIQRGNSIEYVGIAAVYKEADGNFIYPDLMMRIRVFHLIDVDYIHLAINSQCSRDFFQGKATGTSGSMPKINQAVVNSLPIPVPPFAEQKRIIAKVEQLMALCDDLESKLTRAKTKAERMTASTMQAVLAA